MKHSLPTGLLATTCFVLACRQAAPQDWPADPGYQRAAVAESTTLATTTDTIYRRRLQDLIRRSLLVPTDSLARLHRAIPTTVDSLLPPLRQELTCEEWRLIHGHWILASSLLSIIAAIGAAPQSSGAMCTTKRACVASGGACYSNCSDCCKGSVCVGAPQVCNIVPPEGVCS